MMNTTIGPPGEPGADRSPAAGASARSAYVHRLLASEISAFTAYYDRLIQAFPLPHDSGALFDCIRAPEKVRLSASEELPDLSSERGSRTAVLLNGTFNHDFDIQGLLQRLRPRLSRTSRLVAVTYNPYARWAFRLANLLGLRRGEMPTVFLTRTDLRNLCALARFEVVRIRAVAYLPWRLLGVGDLVNRLMPVLPGLRWLALVNVVLIRPLVQEGERRPSLSVVVPARNERGNIESAVHRMPELGTKLELIFVEGHSTDGTWEEIQRVQEAHGSRFSIRAFQQAGTGKNDAVRLGLSEATGELVTVLDADLTMPPELLGRFYEAYREGLADFVNGTRLVYPMEGESMRLLNHLGNIFFAKALSLVLGVRIGDSLCGTKLLARHDYRRITAWRADFGDFDPFGDFELLFPAAILGLGVVDVPIRYRARTYGSTSIRRFRDGALLLRMTLLGLFRIALGRG